jgi:hypothetical protein
VQRIELEKRQKREIERRKKAAKKEDKGNKSAIEEDEEGNKHLDTWA